MQFAGKKEFHTNLWKVGKNNWCLLAKLHPLKAQYSGHYALHASVVVLVFMGARHPLLLKSSILTANKSLGISNIKKMADKRLQRAMLNGQYRVLKRPVSQGFCCFRSILW